jgi:hypothetical protein
LVAHVIPSITKGGYLVKKNIVSIAVMLLVLLMTVTLSTVGFAAEKVTGEVVKMEGEFITVKDDKGKEHKFHVNKETKQMGEVKTGSKVEVEATPPGHATMIMGPEKK